MTPDEFKSKVLNEDSLGTIINKGRLKELIEKEELLEFFKAGNAQTREDNIRAMLAMFFILVVGFVVGLITGLYA